MKQPYVDSCSINALGQSQNNGRFAADRLNSSASLPDTGVDLTREPDSNPPSLMFTVTRYQLLNFQLVASKPKHTERVLGVNPVDFYGVHVIIRVLEFVYPFKAQHP